MKAWKWGIALLIGLLAVGLLNSGCGRDEAPATSAVDPGTEQVLDLDAENGGFLPIDEEPAFGDPALAVLAGREEEVEDGYAGLGPEGRRHAKRLEDDHRRVRYSLTILWGFRPGAGDSLGATSPVEWKGSLAIEEGAIRLLRLIDFERREDRVLPRTRPDSIAWTSVTSDFMDGLRLLVTVADSGAPAVPLALRLNEYTRELTTADLEDLEELIDLGDGTRVVLRSFRMDSKLEAHGFCSGLWEWPAENPCGEFRGTWTREEGRMAGFLRGIAGYNRLGEPVFFGKFTGERGNFSGFLRGSWTRSENEGRFEGEWITRTGQALGRVQGVWISRAAGSGVFNGTWRGHPIAP